jgi:hypothetical protein
MSEELEDKMRWTNPGLKEIGGFHQTAPTDFCWSGSMATDNWCTNGAVPKIGCTAGPEIHGCPDYICSTDGAPQG